MFLVLFILDAGRERDASIEAVINWLLENPDMSSCDVIESEEREAAAAESKLSFLFIEIIS